MNTVLTSRLEAIKAGITLGGDGRAWHSLNGVRRMPDGNLADLRKSVLESVESILGNKQTEAEKARLYMEAESDSNKRLSLNAIRLEQGRNYIFATNNFASRFFSIDELGASDQPYFQESIHNEISFGYLGQGANPRRLLIEPGDNEVKIPLQWIWSDKYRYNLYDIYNGKVSEAALKTLDMAYDWSNKLDKLAYDLLTASLNNGGVFGAFTLTGTKASRVYVANSRIDTGNLPTTNDLSTPSAGASTKFNLATIRQAVKYCDQFAGAFKDGDLRPEGTIIVPAIHASDLWEEILPTSDNKNTTAIGEALQQAYHNPVYGQIAWRIVPDNTLPATGNRYAYFVLNKPVGRIYFKPSLELEDVQTFKTKNYEERAQGRPIGMYIPTSHRVRVCRVKFATT